VHIDKNRQSPDACLGFEDVIVDQLILTHCDVLVIHRSGVSETAGVLRNQDEGLFRLEEKGITNITVATIYKPEHLARYVLIGAFGTELYVVVILCGQILTKLDVKHNNYTGNHL
jgi:hypothetical protein